MLYSEKTAEAAIRVIVKEVDAVAPCSFEHHPRTRAMLVTVGIPEAHVIVELTEQRMVSTFGLNTSPREIDAERRAVLKRELEVGGRVARSASAWAKGRYGVGLKQVTRVGSNDGEADVQVQCADGSEHTRTFQRDDTGWKLLLTTIPGVE